MITNGSSIGSVLGLRLAFMHGTRLVPDHGCQFETDESWTLTPLCRGKRAMSKHINPDPTMSVVYVLLTLTFTR